MRKTIILFMALFAMSATAGNPVKAVDCNNLDPGTQVTLTATAKDGYVFVNWTENGEVVKDAEGKDAGATYTFSTPADRTLVANFAKDFTVEPESIGNLTYNGASQTPSLTVKD